MTKLSFMEELNLVDFTPDEFADASEGYEADPKPDDDTDQGAVVVHDPFSPVQFKALFDKFQNKIDAMKAEAATVEVKDDESKVRALTMVGEAKQVSAAIEKQRKTAKQPYIETGRAIDGFASPLTDGLKAIIDDLEKKTFIFMAERARKQRAAEAAARAAEEKARREAEAAAAEAQRIAEEKAKADGTVPPPPEPVFVPRISVSAIFPTKTVTETASADIALEWTFHIENLGELLTNERLVTARAAELEKTVTPWINAQIKAGIRSIAGVAIYQTDKLKTRARR